MGMYSQVPSEIEAKRWAALAQWDTPKIVELIEGNKQIIEAMTAHGMGEQSLCQSVVRETTYLREHLQDRGLSLAGA